MSLSGCWNSWRTEHVDVTLKCSCWDMNQDLLCCEATSLTTTVPPCFRACICAKALYLKTPCDLCMTSIPCVHHRWSFLIFYFLLYYILQRPAGAGVSVGTWAYVVGTQGVLWQYSTYTKLYINFKVLNMCVFWVTLGEVIKFPGLKMTGQY